MSAMSSAPSRTLEAANFGGVRTESGEMGTRAEPSFFATGELKWLGLAQQRRVNPTHFNN